MLSFFHPLRPRALSRSLGPATVSAAASLLLTAFPAPAPGQLTSEVDLAETPADGLRAGRVYGSSGSGAVGVPVAGGMDVDGDGRPDFAIAAMVADPLGRTDAGEVHLVFGTGGFLGEVDTTPFTGGVLTVTGAQNKETAGSEIWIDDVTGDGLGDLLVARQNFTPDAERIGAGALTVIPGGAALRTAAEALDYLDLASPAAELGLTTIVGPVEHARLGVWVRAGDIDGDGTSDIVVGADQQQLGDDRHSGAAYVIRGGTHLVDAGTVDLEDFGTTSLVGEIARIGPADGSREFHFASTCAVADLDGNGRGEVLASAALNRAGASLRPEGGGLSQTHPIGGSRDGTAFVVWDDNFPAAPWPAGFTILLDAAPGSVTSIEGADANIKFGEELIGGLDYDSDGTTDLFVGDIVGDFSPDSDRVNGGSGHVIYDIASLKGLTFDLESPPAGFTMTTIAGGNPGAIAGDTTVHGDFDGDGRDDLAVASPHAEALGRDSAGAVHVLFGDGEVWPEFIDLKPGLEPDASDLRMTAVWGALGTDGSDIGDTLAYSATAADVDADGRSDLLINEMLGNGIAPGTEDVGNLVLLSGATIAGLASDGCPAAPSSECIDDAIVRARLRIVDRSGEDRDRFVFRRLGEGDPTTADLPAFASDPDARFAVCVYGDGLPTLTDVSAELAGGLDCGEGACWRTHAAGSAYFDRDASVNGIKRMRIAGGAAGRGIAVASTRGPNAGLPEIRPGLPITAQIHVRDAQGASCWSATFETFEKNGRKVFSSRLPVP